MRNLTGVRGCDSHVQQELEGAGIEVVEHPAPLDQEVRTSLTGVLRLDGEVRLTFLRSCTFWSVAGPVTLEVAQEMYADPIGKHDIRVIGHCGCPPPEEWAVPKLDSLPDELRNRIPRLSIRELAEMCNRGELPGIPRFVRSYHIDTYEGLRLFVETLRQHGLADELGARRRRGRTCPYCGRANQLSAIECRYCGGNLLEETA